ncbi:MAG: hypothetical protein O2894_05520 [Planctomycetota bacterium]|nr:hypothetical protein [Planctomycetota bacterium]
MRPHRIVPSRLPSMRRSLVLLGLLLALFALPAAAIAGPSKEFKTDGFSWALPDQWVFGSVSPDERGGGVVAKAECEAASITAFVYVETSDLDLDGRVNDIKELGAEGMGSVARQAVAETSLSGVKGKVVIKNIKPDSGGEGHFRTYIIKSGGKFYQLIVQAWHGSHASQVEGLNALRKGFRLLQGAGGQDADETMTEVDGGGGDGPAAGDNGGNVGGDGGGDSAEDTGNWPPNGPLREGRKITLPNHNFEWTLPESDLKWVGGIEDAKAESGRLVWALGLIKREKGEFEKDTPDFNRLILDVVTQPLPADFKTATFVTGGGAQNVVEKNWRALTEVESGKTRNKTEVSVGNHTGSYIKFEGPHGGLNRVVMVFTIALRGQLYFIRALGDGHTDVYKHLAPVVGEAIKGINFPETKEACRGPLLIASVPDFAAARGSDTGAEKTYTLPGIDFEKPAGMAKVDAGSRMERELLWAGEARSEDGEAYVYFDISAWQLNISNVPNTDPEEIVKNRTEQWNAGAGESPMLSKRGNPPFWKNGSFGKGKGITYEFTGHLGDVPFTEEAWVVKYKNHLLRFRFQYGGEDAEKKLKDIVRSIKKGVKFKN